MSKELKQKKAELKKLIDEFNQYLQEANQVVEIKKQEILKTQGIIEFLEGTNKGEK